MKTKLNTTQKLVLSAIMMALYIAILFVSQAISFGAVQTTCSTLSGSISLKDKASFFEDLTAVILVKKRSIRN